MSQSSAEDSGGAAHRCRSSPPLTKKERLAKGRAKQQLKLEGAHAKISSLQARVAELEAARDRHQHMLSQSLHKPAAQRAAADAIYGACARTGLSNSTAHALATAASGALANLAAASSYTLVSFPVHQPPGLEQTDGSHAEAMVSATAGLGTFQHSSSAPETFCIFDADDAAWQTPHKLQDKDFDSQNLAQFGPLPSLASTVLLDRPISHTATDLDAGVTPVGSRCVGNAGRASLACSSDDAFPELLQHEGIGSKDAIRAAVVTPSLPLSLSVSGEEHASEDVNATSAVVTPRLPLSLTAGGVEHASVDVNAISAACVVPEMSTAGCADAAAGNLNSHTSTVGQQHGHTGSKSLASTGGEAVASPAPGRRTSHPGPVVLDGGGTSVKTLLTPVDPVGTDTAEPCSTPCPIKATVPHGSQNGAGREPGAVSARIRDKTSRAKRREPRNVLGREPGAVSARIRDKTSRGAPISREPFISSGHVSGACPTTCGVDDELGDIHAATCDDIGRGGNPNEFNFAKLANTFQTIASSGQTQCGPLPSAHDTPLHSTTRQLEFDPYTGAEAGASAAIELLVDDFNSQQLAQTSGPTVDENFSHLPFESQTGDLCPHAGNQECGPLPQHTSPGAFDATAQSELASNPSSTGGDPSTKEELEELVRKLEFLLRRLAEENLDIARPVVLEQLQLAKNRLNDLNSAHQLADLD